MTQSKRTSDAPTPFPLAILVCDSVINDSLTRKTTIVGVFDTVFAAGFPSQQSLTLYARLTDAIGRYRLKVEFVHVEADQMLGQADSELEDVDDRLKIMEITLALPPVPLPVPGTYEFRVWANEKYIGRAWFRAASASKAAQHE